MTVKIHPTDRDVCMGDYAFLFGPFVQAQTPQLK
jgi:hypothetical protein